MCIVVFLLLAVPKRDLGWTASCNVYSQRASWYHVGPDGLVNGPPFLLISPPLSLPAIPQNFPANDGMNGSTMTALNQSAVDQLEQYMTSAGLPPKPISYVGKETLDIIFENYKTDFLFYFFNNSLKRHIFSKTYIEHKKKLNEYKISCIVSVHMRYHMISKGFCVQIRAS